MTEDELTQLDRLESRLVTIEKQLKPRPFLDRWGIYLGMGALALSTIAGFVLIQQDRSHRRTELEQEAQHNAAITRDAYLTTCNRQNENRAAIRGTVEGFATLIGAFVVESAEDQDRAHQFADRLTQLAEQAASESAPPVDCTYPPKPAAQQEGTP